MVCLARSYESWSHLALLCSRWRRTEVEVLERELLLRGDASGVRWPGSTGETPITPTAQRDPGIQRVRLTDSALLVEATARIELTHDSSCCVVVVAMQTTFVGVVAIPLYGTRLVLVGQLPGDLSSESTTSRLVELVRIDTRTTVELVF